jgi:hypothetical protein
MFDIEKGSAMVSWQPNWHDVAYDYHRADEAIASCRNAIAVLHDRHFALTAPRLAAIEHWQGGHRRIFDAEWFRLEAMADAAAVELHETIRRIEADRELAYAEQRHREQQRIAWRRDKAVEDEQARRNATANDSASCSATSCGDTSGLHELR